MGNFTETITLKNARDVGNAGAGIIAERDVRRVTVDAVPDTGASTMFITEDVCRALGLAAGAERVVNIADGTRVLCRTTEPVSIHWKDRSTSCGAVVIPGARKNLLGAIPLEGMDLRVNPVKRCLEGANGDETVYQALTAGLL